MPLGIKPTVDFAFKKIFGSPENVPSDRTAQRDPPACLPIVQVEILNPFSYQDFADDKLIVLDIRARDSAGRWLNVEMQVTVFGGLLQRLVYYACRLYVDQLGTARTTPTCGPRFRFACSARSCSATPSVPHHRFRLADPEHDMEISDTIEVHTVELTKYNLSEGTISRPRPSSNGRSSSCLRTATSRSGCGNCCRAWNFSERLR